MTFLLNNINYNILQTDQEVDTFKLKETQSMLPENQINVEKVEKNIGHWNQTQKELYQTFLIEHKEIFLKQELKRRDKVFKEMSKFLKTRAADQCRSHHQKMFKKFGSFQKIIQSIQDTQCINYEKQIAEIFQNQQNKICLLSKTIQNQFGDYKSKKCQLTCSQNNQFQLQSLGQLQFVIKSPGLFFEQTDNIDNYQLI